MLTTIYAQIARARRRLYQDGARQRRLRRPVISVGNLRVGGSGKTPAVAHLARLLIEAGERPAILSRGYGRRRAPDGVVVVADGTRRLADLDASGDEPLMLACALPGARVLVARERHLAGVLAEHHLNATVHLLDDGFQHLQLHRDLDLLIVSPEDVADGRTLPSGRLREPLSAARAASALLVPDASEDEARAVGERLGVARVFRLARLAGSPRRLDVPAGSAAASVPASAFAVAGIARPDRFFAELAAAGWTLAGTLSFPDHCRYRARDVARIAREAKQAGAGVIVTTEKDLMRLLPFRPLPLPIVWVT